MRIYDTRSKKLEDFQPRNGKTVQMFVCGPTVYDYVHVGNARVFVFFDVVAKYLKHRGYDVRYIQNITDIDDKIIKRAEEEKRPALDLAKDYTEKFKSDMANLGVTSPVYAPATNHIPEVLKQVKTLIEKNNAYEIPGDGWYFDLKTFPSYGKLSGRTAQMADDAVSRIDENENKRNSGDFCIWKLSKPNEPSWTDAELGAGRPGWHIEDTAITEHFFGPQYDLHGGGQDLIFPHHEAEIAQQESASGKEPFVRYWMHVGFLVLQARDEDKKMSKSAGNFKTVNEILKEYSKETVRFYLLSGHYRTPLQFADKILNQARAAIQRIAEFYSKLDLAGGPDNETAQIALNKAYDQFFGAMDDDFNTSKAFAAVFDLIRTVNPLLLNNQISEKDAAAIKYFFKELSDILGIVKETADPVPAEINSLVQKRESCREAKKFDESDKLRVEIQGKGWEIEDTAYGPLVFRKN